MNERWPSRWAALVPWLLLGASVAAAASPAATLPAPATWVEVNNVILRYQLLGDGGETVVLLHELSMSLESWDELLPAIAPKRQVLRYDLRGSGLSERVTAPITMQDEVEDLRALLDRLKLREPVTLVGSTAGAAIALHFASDYPARVKGVVAISPAAYMQPQTQRLSARHAGEPVRSARELRVEEHEEIFPAAIRSAHPERLMRYRGMFYSSDPEGSYETTRMLYSIGFANVLPRIRCPVLIIAASQFTRSVDSLRELAAAIPQGRLAVVESGHLASLESPELVQPLLLEFIRSLR
jgi:3-oxoadipate enol-lactonase